ncbi:MAG: ABC transporter substrate-binding protein [Clostridia bacterium]|nr:ABC transporter substrate-binding protein [Clostridia bacterium]
MKKLLSLALALSLLMSLAALPALAEDQAVNIAVTSTLGTINPLLMDNTEVVKYAESLVFLPLVELNNELEFVPQLAESITTEDNLTFTIKLREDAKWSDGEPVTSADVVYTLLAWATPATGAYGVDISSIVGLEDGYLPEGADQIAGVTVVDDKTLTIATQWETTLFTFENNIGRYILILPEHALKDIPFDQLLTGGWFDRPEVVSGPYFIRDFDLNHYVHYVANENYFEGAPKIKYINLNVLQSSQLLAGLQAGEIDLIHPTMGAILMEDYDAVRALPGYTYVTGSPITNQSIFINVNNVPDRRIRQALLYGIDRETILDGFLFGNGEIVDAFLSSVSPYFSEELGVTAYDPDKAAALIAEAKADGADTAITWHAWSGDETFLNAVNFIAAQFAEIGLTIDVRPVDLDQLMALAGDYQIQVMSVQYSYNPLDPYTDVAWLLSADGWTQYDDEAVNAALTLSQALTDPEAIKAQYLIVDRAVVENAPMISAYVLSTLGTKSDKLKNVNLDVYGTFVNVQDWEIQ